jgi:O-antigen ligase
MRYQKEIHQKILFVLCLLLAFLIPVYGKFLPGIILLITLNWLIEGRYIRCFSTSVKKQSRIQLLLFTTLYLLYILGLCWSSNLKYGGFDLQVKLSLLVFPLVFWTTAPETFTGKKMHYLLLAFVAGCLAGTLYLYAWALHDQLVLNQEGSFYYRHLSRSFNPCYLAMYNAFAVSALFYLLSGNLPGLNRIRKAGLILLMIHFSLFILLLSSKAGLLSLAVIILFWAVILAFRRREWIVGILVVVTGSVFFAGGLALFPFASGRISETREALQTRVLPGSEGIKSTGDRVLILQASVRLVGEHPLFGVGTGDVKDELIREYTRIGFTKGIEGKLNAHNQYLQTFIALGIPGFILLVSLLLLPSILAAKGKQYLYLSFLILFSLNLLFESMLERQAGVVFYGFFNSFLFLMMNPFTPQTAAESALR